MIIRSLLKRTFSSSFEGMRRKVCARKVAPPLPIHISPIHIILDLINHFDSYYITVPFAKISPELLDVLHATLI